MKRKIVTMGGLGLSVLLAVAVSSCSTIDMPKGSSREYSSARFIRVNPASKLHAAAPSKNKKVNAMIQEAITAQFEHNGLRMTENDADLIIGYLLIRQDNVSTAMVNDHFGYSRDSDKIINRAHELDVIVKGGRTEAFEVGAIVIDLIDAKTNELVYRNYAKRDIVNNISDDAREERITGAVSEALSAFFQ